MLIAPPSFSLGHIFKNASLVNKNCSCKAYNPAAPPKLPTTGRLILAKQEAAQSKKISRVILGLLTIFTPQFFCFRQPPLFSIQPARISGFCGGGRIRLV